MKKFKLFILSTILVLSLLTATACSFNLPSLGGGSGSGEGEGGGGSTPPANSPVITQVEGTQGLTYKIEKTNKGIQYAVCTGVEKGSTLTDIVIASHYQDVLVKEVKQAAFKGNTNIKSVKMVNAMEKIDFYAFQNCSSLESVILPETLTKISQNAFDGCELLLNVCNDSKLDIKKGTTNHGSVGNYACNIYSSTSGAAGEYKSEGEFDVFAFSGNRFVLKYNGSSSVVNFPDNTTGIYKDAFKGNTKITEVNFPATITYIGKSAFADCTSLQKVTFAQNTQVSEFGVNAFYGCEALKEYNYNNTLEQYMNIDYADDYANPIRYANTIAINGETLYYLSIPNNITVVKSFLFNYCESIRKIYIPASVETIEMYAFAYTGAEEISFVENAQLKTIGANSFAHSEKITELKFPASVERLGVQSFTECNNLVKVTFANNNNLYRFDQKAFASCDKLEHFFVGHNSALKEVGDRCFSYCVKMKYFSFGNNSVLEKIESYAFQANRPLKSLYIPSTCLTMGAWTFSGCFQTRETDDLQIYIDLPSRPLTWNEQFNSSKCDEWWGTPYPYIEE